MDKILEFALKSAKPDIKAMLKVINATPNAQVAAEILLGVYVHPHVPHEPSQSIKDAYHNPVFVKYDEFQGEVFFEYTPADHQTGWVPKGLAVATTDDFASKKNSVLNAAEELEISTDELEEKYEQVTIVTNVRDYRFTNSTSLKRWSEG